MSEFTKQASEATDQYLSFLAQSQDAFLEAAAQAPKFTSDESQKMPYFAELAPNTPTTREVTEAAFGFAEKLLAQQKEYTEKFLAVAEIKAPASK